MKNFHRILFIIVAVALCGLCVFQWRIQTLQRTEIQKVSDTLYQKELAIQGYTNSIKTLDAQVAQMQSQMSTFEQSTKSNQQHTAELQREL
ncbi:MAG: hypothetical protein ACXWIU_05465, partial [Limisphaerales bacterium]